VLFVPEPFRDVIRSMWLMMITSALISLGLILAFAYFIHTILRQKKLSQMKNDFINNMTHEFKTPITNISLALENISESNLLTDTYLRIISEENEHMRENAERILQIAMLDKEEMKLNKTDVDLHELILRAARSFDLQLAHVKGTIRLNLAAEKHHTLADETHMINVFYNMLDNAIKYCKNSPDIVIATKNKDHHISITITDNGIGMSEEVSRHVFDRFFRGSSGDVHDVKGFGLGLNYVKKIVGLHGGSIDVKSTPGKGSVFEIILPV
jgi:two-component system, OmpR family, phosphate regulon sensor histidine kinase PhoR